MLIAKKANSADKLQQIKKKSNKTIHDITTTGVCLARPMPGSAGGNNVVHEFIFFNYTY